MTTWRRVARGQFADARAAHLPCSATFDRLSRDADVTEGATTITEDHAFALIALLTTITLLAGHPYEITGMVMDLETDKAMAGASPSLSLEIF